MYGTLIETAAEMWSGGDPVDVHLTINGRDNDYLRGQVEFILALGVKTPHDGLDMDTAAYRVAADIRATVSAADVRARQQHRAKRQPEVLLRHCTECQSKAWFSPHDDRVTTEYMETIIADFPHRCDADGVSLWSILPRDEVFR